MLDGEPAGTPASESGPVLWAGTVRGTPLPARVTAAAQAGYGALSLSPLDCRRAQAAGMPRASVRAAVADAGLRVSCLDPYTRWLPRWDPPADHSPYVLEFVGTEEREFFATAEAVGATSMTVFEPFGVRWPDEVVAESLAAVSARAADSGMRVNLEPIPFLGVPDLATAWRLVQMSGVADAGIVLDAWHFYRGGADHELLSTIPGSRVGAVQLSDALTEPVGDLETDCLHHRLPVGDGVFPLNRLLRVLRTTGGLHDVGPEIFSDAFDGRPAAVNAAQALQGLGPWLAATGSPAPVSLS